MSASHDASHPHPSATRRRVLLAFGAAAAGTVAGCGSGGSSDATTTPAAATQQLYTQTNETANTVVRYARNADGTLVRKETVATGGVGTNALRLNGTPGPNSLAGQFAVAMNTDRTLLFVANAGDSSISMMAIDPATGVPSVKKRVLVLGDTPNSLAFSNGVLYVTFLRGNTQLGAYRVASDGGLLQLGLYDIAAQAGITSVAPTQVAVSVDGNYVVVSPGTATNALVTYPVNADGSLAAPVTTKIGVTSPFAGLFRMLANGTQIFLSTGISGVSLTSYTVGRSGALTQLSQGSATGVAAPCWLTLSVDGGVAWVGNGSGSISSYAISATGGVTLLDATAAAEPGLISGVTSVAGDSWASPDGKYFYSTYLGDDKIVAYAVQPGGVLNKLGEQVVGTSTHLSLQGLVGN